tara:strand:+ start:41 stop:508 length:468 start_codon:yes stop_codon:yes gene_type:complete
MKIFIITQFLISVVLCSTPKYNIEKIEYMISENLIKNNYKIKLLSVDSFTDKNKISIQLNVQYEGADYSRVIIEGFKSMAKSSIYSKNKISDFILIIHSNNFNSTPRFFSASSDCSVNYFTENKIIQEKWFSECLFDKLILSDKELIYKNINFER